MWTWIFGALASWVPLSAFVQPPSCDASALASLSGMELRSQVEVCWRSLPLQVISERMTSLDLYYQRVLKSDPRDGLKEWTYFFTLWRERGEIPLETQEAIDRLQGSWFSQWKQESLLPCEEDQCLLLWEARIQAAWFLEIPFLSGQPKTFPLSRVLNALLESGPPLSAELALLLDQRLKPGLEKGARWKQWVRVQQMTQALQLGSLEEVSVSDPLLLQVQYERLKAWSELGATNPIQPSASQHRSFVAQQEQQTEFQKAQFFEHWQEAFGEEIAPFRRTSQRMKYELGSQELLTHFQPLSLEPGDEVSLEVEGRWALGQVLGVVGAEVGPEGFGQTQSLGYIEVQGHEGFQAIGDRWDDQFKYQVAEGRVGNHLSQVQGGGSFQEESRATATATHSTSQQSVVAHSKATYEGMEGHTSIQSSVFESTGHSLQSSHAASDTQVVKEDQENRSSDSSLTGVSTRHDQACVADRRQGHSLGGGVILGVNVGVSVSGSGTAAQTWTDSGAVETEACQRLSELSSTQVTSESKGLSIQKAQSSTLMGNSTCSDGTESKALEESLDLKGSKCKDVEKDVEREADTQEACQWESMSRAQWVSQTTLNSMQKSFSQDHTRASMHDTIKDRGERVTRNQALDRRVDASFRLGIYSDRAPFPEYPVGALLWLELEPDGLNSEPFLPPLSQIRPRIVRVRPVSSGLNLFEIPQASLGILWINDEPPEWERLGPKMKILTQVHKAVQSGSGEGIFTGIEACLHSLSQEAQAWASPLNGVKSECDWRVLRHQGWACIQKELRQRGVAWRAKSSGLRSSVQRGGALRPLPHGQEDWIWDWAVGRLEQALQGLFWKEQARLHSQTVQPHGWAAVGREKAQAVLLEEGARAWLDYLDALIQQKAGSPGVRQWAAPQLERWAEYLRGGAPWDPQELQAWVNVSLRLGPQEVRGEVTSVPARR